MCTKNINIGEAELEIMKVLWSKKEPMNLKMIGEAVADKGWKKTTVATFLARLTQKEIISAEKQGACSYYTPLISEKEYRRIRTRGLIKSLFNGSVKELAASLFEGDGLSKEDVKELTEIYENGHKKP